MIKKRENKCLILQFHDNKEDLIHEFYFYFFYCFYFKDIWLFLKCDRRLNVNIDSTKESLIFLLHITIEPLLNIINSVGNQLLQSMT